MLAPYKENSGEKTVWLQRKQMANYQLFQILFVCLLHSVALSICLSLLKSVVFNSLSPSLSLSLSLSLSHLILSPYGIPLSLSLSGMNVLVCAILL